MVFIDFKKYDHRALLALNNSLIIAENISNTEKRRVS